MSKPDMNRFQNYLLKGLFPAILLVAWAASCFAGEFDRIRSEVWDSGGESAPSPARPSRKDVEESEHRGHRSHEDSGSFHLDDDDDGFFGKLFFGALTSPFWGPHVALGDDFSMTQYFPEHPYENADGSMLADRTPRGAHGSSVVLQGQYGDNFDGIRHANARILMENVTRFGIDSEFNYRNEKLAAGHDELWTGDFNVTYRFAQSEQWQFRSGLGVNWLADHGSADAGFNFTYGTDWFPADPWVVTSVIDWGRIGDASLFHGRATIGVSHNGWGVFTGYYYFKIGDVDIQSWINGVELRF